MQKASLRMHKYLPIFSMMLQQISLVNWNIRKKIVADVIIYIMYINTKKIINNPLNTINNCRRWWINVFMTEMMESFHNSNKSYFLCIRLAMISKQKIIDNLGGSILADSFNLSNKEKAQKTQLKQFHSNITLTTLTSCSCSILMLGFAFTSSNMGFKFFIRRMSNPKICA